MNNSIYIDYINSHVNEIAEYVNNCFDSSKDSIRTKIIRKIQEQLTPLPTHYVKKQDGNPYDYSGIIVSDGNISLNLTVADFLKNEYSGNKEATYISKMGWNYNTYADELSYDTLEIAAEIMFPAIQKHVESHFKVKFTDEEFEKIKESCGDFDEIYDNCIASDFFFSSFAIEYVDIGNIKLADIRKEEY